MAALSVGHGTTIRISRVNQLVPQPFAILGWVVDPGLGGIRYRGHYRRIDRAA